MKQWYFVPSFSVNIGAKDISHNNHGIKGTMKINKLIPFIFACAVSFLVTACSSVRFVTIKNDSAASIEFQGEFITATNEIDNLAFQLKPSTSNSWRYELSSFDSDVLDKGLNKITLSVSSECSVTLDRSQIEEMAEKNGMWFITIDAEVISCK
tara:strand:- start:204 stop:665 length:462 start_codon:yes stop_codon:yes gene_type:complete